MKLLKIAILASYMALAPVSIVMAADSASSTEVTQEDGSSALGAEALDTASEAANEAKDKATEQIWEPLTGGIEKTIQDPEAVNWVAENAHAIAVVIGAIVVLLVGFFIWKVLPVVFRMIWRTLVYAYDEICSLLFFKSTTRKSKGFLPVGTVLTFNGFTAVHTGDGAYKASNGDVYHIDSLAKALAAGGKVKIRGGFPVGGTLKIPLGEKGKLHAFEITRRGLLTKYYGNTNIITLPMLRDLGLIYVQEAADKEAAIKLAEEEVAMAAQEASYEEHDNTQEAGKSTEKKTFFKRIWSK